MLIHSFSRLHAAEEAKKYCVEKGLHAIHAGQGHLQHTASLYAYITRRLKALSRLWTPVSCL
jgi:hypothetical protein